MEILIASANVHKIREFRAMLASMKDLDVLTLQQYPDYIPPKETETTFEENALLKARDAAKKCGKWAFADDSGLVVPKLKGAPGVWSARYAGEGATDAKNRKKLLEEMAKMTGLERNAYYECVIALVSPDGEERTFSGICEGHILEEEKGGHGFGYDPLFVKHDYDKTFAEMKEELKNCISHRRKAFDKFATALEKIEAFKVDQEA